ncbi:MAG: hypothetical protein ACLGHR_10290 [Gammaproteobacteria bacterium]
MASIIIPSRWNSQPTGPVELSPDLGFPYIQEFGYRSPDKVPTPVGIAYAQSSTPSTGANQVVGPYTLLWYGMDTAARSVGPLNLFSLGSGVNWDDTNFRLDFSYIDASGGGDVALFRRGAGGGANRLVSGANFVHSERPMFIAVTGGGVIEDAVSIYINGRLDTTTVDDARSTGVAVTSDDPVLVGNAYCPSFYALALRGSLPAAQISALAANPWQAFRPQRRVLYFDVAGGGPATYTHTASLNATIRAAQSATASLSAAIQQPNTATASLSAAIRQALASAASVDAAVLQARTATASLDALIQAAGTNTATASLNAAVQQQRTATASMDAAIRQAFAASAALDAAIRQSGSAGASLDAAVRQARTLQAALDAFIEAPGTLSASLDAAIQAPHTAVASLSAAIAAAQTAVASLDAAIATRYTASASLDGYIHEASTLTASLDAAILAAQSVSASLNAYILSADALGKPYAVATIAPERRILAIPREPRIKPRPRS